MFMRRNLLSITVALVVLAAAASARAQRIVRFVPDPSGARLYEPYDIGITVRFPVATNPFTDVAIDATFTPQGGSPIVVHGFCDSSDGTVFRVRFCPSKRVRHTVHVDFTDTFSTVSWDSSFDVGWSADPGFVRRDLRFGGRLVRERTGETWFHNGCTSLVFMLAGQAAAQSFVDRMAADGFNRCRIVVSGGIRSPFDDQEMNPFVGYDFTRFNVDYWRTLESRIRYMKDRGMVADVIFLIEWGTFIYRFIDRTSITEAEWRYFRYAIDRLGAFTNVTWNLGNEYPEYHSPNWANLMGDRVKSYDPYGHILTAHVSNAVFPHTGNAWADTVCLQAYAGGSAVTVRQQWNVLKAAISGYLASGKPTIDDEYGYEPPYPADVVRKSHWTIDFSGGYATYGSFEAQTIRSDDSSLLGGEVVPEQLSHLVEFVSGTLPHLLQPDDPLVVSSEHLALCRALRGHEYAVYLPDGGAVTLDVSHANGAPLPVEWWVPATGQRIAAGTTGTAATFTATPPFAGDALLHVGRIHRDEHESWDFTGRAGASEFQVGRGTWTARAGAYGQVDRHETVGWSWIRGRVARDLVLDANVQIVGGADARAGVVLRAQDPRARLGTTDAVLVSFQQSGVVEAWEIVDRMPRRLASRTAATWHTTSFNRVSVGLRDDRLVVIVNGAVVLTAASRNPHPPAEGFVGLFTVHGRAGFDDVRVRPIFFRDFEDGSLRGLHVVSGTWEASAAHVEQTARRGGGMTLGNESYRRFQIDASIRIPATNGRGAGLALRTASPTAGFLESGYLLHWDGARTVSFVKAVPGGPPQILAQYQDPEAGGVLRAGWNHFDVKTTATRFTVSANGTLLFTAEDVENRWPSGYVQLRDLAGGSRFDNLNALSLE
jgi:uncharacterized protein DUF4038/uncharacterized protein DUF5060/collagenase-like protein with putative collagen-binding domain/3-keto-disaccharide hydrolase